MARELHFNELKTLVEMSHFITEAKLTQIFLTILFISQSVYASSGPFKAGTNIPAQTFCRVSATTTFAKNYSTLSIVEMVVGALLPIAPIEYRNNFVNEINIWSYHPQFESGAVNMTGTRRPILRDQKMNLQFLQNDGSWSLIDLKSVIIQYAASLGTQINPSEFSLEGDFTDKKVVMDKNCNLYTTVNLVRNTKISDILFLFSSDEGNSWSVYPLGIHDQRKTVRMEFSGNGSHILLDNPPTLLVHNFYDLGVTDNVSRALYLYIPELTPSGLNVGPKFTVSQNSLLVTSHSGESNAAVSIGDNVSVIYPIASTQWNGVNYHYTVYLGRVYSRKYKNFVTNEFFVTRSPSNRLTPVDVYDSHDEPALIVDSNNYIHFIANSHNGPFYYGISQNPGAISWGFKNVITVGNEIYSNGGAGYSYASPVIDVYNNLHVIARVDDSDAKYKLVHLIKPLSASYFTMFTDPDTKKLVPHQLLINPYRTRYGVYYHKVTTDPWGSVWVSYSYMPDQLTAAEAAAYKSRYNLTTMTIVSGTCLMDGSVQRCSYRETVARDHLIMSYSPKRKNWKLITTDDFF